MRTHCHTHASRQFRLVEKSNHNAVHAIFDSRSSAERHLRDVIPDYCARGLFMDKTLCAGSFEIIPQPVGATRKASLISQP